ncbi:MAG: hypothetical protein KDI36_17955, partial [Pseudomonadales bacterium]|nr:hypothetical protein [Pseudomonadales bacterium]
ATGVELARELQLRINNDEKIADSGDSVTVSYDSNNHRFSFQSSEYGSASVISFVSEDAHLAGDLGFGAAVGTVIAGLDVKGKINGEAATGAGQYLRASDGALAAKPGFLTGSAIGSLNVPLSVSSADVSSGAYRFKINVDGIVSTAIDLPEGTYNTGAELATALQGAINGNGLLSAAGKSVTVEYDIGLSTFGVISTTTGKNSQVNFTEMVPAMISQFAFGIGGGTQGQEATGQLSDAAGMRIRVIGGSLGNRGTVSYIEGTAYKLNQLFDEILRPDGLLETKMDSLNTLMEGVADSRLKLDERMEKLQDQLVSQFSSADQLISKLKSTEDFLSQQLTILNAMFSGKDK